MIHKGTLIEVCQRDQVHSLLTAQTGQSRQDSQPRSSRCGTSAQSRRGWSIAPTSQPTETKTNMGNWHIGTTTQVQARHRFKSHHTAIPVMPSALTIKQQMRKDNVVYICGLYDKFIDDITQQVRTVKSDLERECRAGCGWARLCSGGCVCQNDVVAVTVLHQLIELGVATDKPCLHPDGSTNRATGPPLTNDVTVL